MKKIVLMMMTFILIGLSGCVGTKNLNIAKCDNVEDKNCIVQEKNIKPVNECKKPMIINNITYCTKD